MKVCEILVLVSILILVSSNAKQSRKKTISTAHVFKPPLNVPTLFPNYM
jgi:hypothetical protein